MFFVVDKDGLIRSSVIDRNAGVGVINICEKQDQSIGEYRPNKYRLIEEIDTETSYKINIDISKES